MSTGLLSDPSPSGFGVARSGVGKLEASSLQVIRNPRPSRVPAAEDLAFGKHVTDHMLRVKWSEGHGWHKPQILPYQDIALDPTACVFHYGFECFEGLKAYRDRKGQIRLFRPGMNLDRFNKSAARIALPVFDSEELLRLIAEFVKLEERFISAQPGYSLYIRPVMIGTNRGLGVAAPTSALLYIIASPVGAYYSSGFRPILLEATSSCDAARAWPGGAGNQKIGGNYAPCIAPEKAAQRRGFHQILWLFGEDDSITEAGTMNLFIVLRVRDSDHLSLVTPPLDGTILPGVTRDCVLSLARERLEPQGWLVQERKICMAEIADASEAAELVEVFGTGTAAVVSPVRSIKWQGKTVSCGLGLDEHAGKVTSCMKDWIESRQYGIEEHEWSLQVDCIAGAT